jgi:hypothetical protein
LDEVTRTSACSSPPVRSASVKRSPNASLKPSSSPARISRSAVSVGVKPDPDRSAFVTAHDATMYVDEVLTALLWAKSNFAPPLKSA